MPTRRGRRGRCPLDAESCEGGELGRVEPVAALFLVGDPYPGPVGGPVWEVLDVGPSGSAAAFAFEVLGEGLDTFVEGFRPRPDVVVVPGSAAAVRAFTTRAGEAGRTPACRTQRLKLAPTLA